LGGTAHNNKSRNLSSNDAFKNIRLVKSYCHKYIGDAISGYEDLLLPIDKLRYNEEHKFQLNLF
jgi:hypothetical protein